MFRFGMSILLGSLLIVSSTSWSRAADGMTNADLDKKLFNGARKAISKGVPLYNKGDYSGCYRVYEGALLVAVDLLDHKPDLQKQVNAALDKAGRMNAENGAFVLRDVLDVIAGVTLWDRLGGEKAVRAVVHEFVLKAATNPKVNFSRGGKFQLDDKAVANLEQLLVEQISSVSGGPLKYTGRDMKSSHKGMKITEAEFVAIAGDLVDTLKKFGVKQREIDDLVGIIATTKKDIVETPLWDRLGGEKAVRAVVHDFVVKTAGNPKVNFFRDGKFKLDARGVARLEQLLVELISQVGGGPLKYTGRSMKESHQGMKITEAEFGAIAGDLIEVLKSYKVPQAEIDELVGIIATTKNDIVETPLWDRLGGEKAVRLVIHDFVVKTAGNPKVNFFRDGKFKLEAKDVEKLEQLLVELVSQVSGGPLKYTGRSMKESHKGMKITEAEFNALAGDLIEVLKSYKVPQAEIDELVGIIATTKNDIVGQ